MMCPVCGKDTAVKDSRPSDLNTIRRRRVCEDGHKTITWESTVNPVARNVQQRRAEQAYRERRRLMETPEERTARHKAERLRKMARSEAKASGEPVEIVYQRWGVAA